MSSLLWKGAMCITGLQRTLHATMRQQTGKTHGRQSCLQNDFINPFILKGPLVLGPPGTAPAFFFSNTLLSTSQFKWAEEKSRYSRCFSLEFKTQCERIRDRTMITGTSCSMTLNGKANLKRSWATFWENTIWTALWYPHLSHAS